jgi:hypothetical protein
MSAAPPLPPDESGAASASESQPEKPPARRPRRWRRRLAIAAIVAVVGLAVLLALLPRIAGAPVVYNRVLAMVNGGLQGAVQIDGLSLSWGGPIEVRGLTITDPQRQQVVRVERVSAAAGLWRLITSTMAFGEVVIDAPSIVIHQRQDGQITLAQALAAREPAEPRPAGALPEPRGRLVVRNGRVQVTREGAGSYEVRDIGGQVDLATLSDIAAKLELTLADGAKLATDAELRGLVTQGELRPEGATGTLRVAADRRIELASLAALAGLAIGLTELQSTQRAAAGAAPVNAALRGEVGWTGEALSAQLDLSGDVGQAHAELAYRPGAEPVAVTADEIVSAILTGGALALPDFTLAAQADVDLAKLGRAVPELLSIREDVELTGGRLAITQLAVRGGAAPTANAAIELKDIAAQRAGQPVRLEPIAVHADAGLTGGEGLRVARLELTSGFAQLSASGLASDLRTTFAADLGRLQRELGQVFELGAFELAGAVRGTVALRRAGDTQVDVTVETTAEQVRYAAEGRAFELPRASVTHRGQLVLTDGALTRVTIDECGADLNGEVVARAAGWYDVAGGALKLDAGVTRGDLAFAAGRAQTLGVAELARYGGTLTMQAAIERAGEAQPLRTRGELVVQGLAVDGQSVLDGPARLTWDGVALAADGSGVEVATAQLESTLAQLAATGVKWRGGEAMTLEGQVTGTADVARCIRAATPLAGWEQPPQLAGRLTVTATGRAAASVITLAGQGGIAGFVIGAGADATAAEDVQFAYDVQVDQAREAVTIGTGRLTSQPLTAEVTGTIGQYGGEMALDLRGRYSASWESITALLHQLAPATASTVIVTGTSASEFRVTGPAQQSAARPTFRGVRSGVEVGWGSADVYGVPMEAARLAPALADGRLTLPPTGIAASGGTVNLGAVLDFEPEDPTLRMPGKTQLLDNVAVTKALSAELLSRINPVFLHVASIEGRVNLGVQDVLAPLGPSLQQRGAAQGRLEFAQVKVAPSGLLAELLSLAGMAPGTPYPVEIGALDFVMREGRIVYDNLTLMFPANFDLRFRGSVGLDETLDLVVSVPVRAELLQKLGVRGPTAEYARMLGDVRVELPLVGTREQPRLDFGKVDVQSLLKDVLQQGAGRQLEDLLRGVGERSRERQ